MRRGSGVGVILLLALGLVATPSYAQVSGGASPGARDRGTRLEQNYPNPFNPETRIPFELDESLFADGTPVKVTIRIYNILGQPIATPIALNHTEKPGAPVDQLVYTVPGRHEAHWDGRYQRTGQEVPSGQYYVQLTVEARERVRHTMPVTVAK